MSNNEAIEESIELANSLRVFLRDYYREEINDQSFLDPRPSIAALMSVLIQISKMSGISDDLICETFEKTIKLGDDNG